MEEIITLPNGRKIVIGVNDLATTHPELVKEWSDELLPTHFSKGSNQEIDWKCSECGYEWSKSIKLRVSGRGCPVCAGAVVAEGVNDLFTTEPKLAEEWDDSTLSPTEVSRGSAKIVQWKCKNDHRWKASVKNRSQGRGCPLCAGRKVVIGVNDLTTTHPEIVEYWNDDKFFPTEFTKVSRRKIKWRCEEGHEWSESISSRVLSEDCPVCTGSKVVRGINDLMTTHPALVREWGSGNQLSPRSLSFISRKKVNWRCSVCGGEWEDSVNSRISDDECPHCVKEELAKRLRETKLVVAGIESLNERWDHSKNTADASFVRIDSREKYWWNCDLGHSFHRRVNSEHSEHSCPICTNREILIGFNDLTTTHPDLVKEWSDDSDPIKFTYGSKKKVYWMCEEGHEWSARISDRTSGVGCPECFKSGLSKKEREFQDLIKSLLSDEDMVLNDRILISPKELDVYIPSKQIAFEFNGLYWHTEEKGKDSTYHHSKYSECRDKGVQLIQVWEDDWDERRSIVEEMVKNKLGLSDRVKIGARKTVVREIPSHESRLFLDEHHIQGFVGASKHYALKYDEEVVAVLSMKRRGGTEGEWELVRYATSVIVQGGFSKLLKHAIRELAPSKIITFSDNSLSDGGLYENTGFTLDAEISPDYSYLYGEERVHKFNFRLKRFRTDPELRYEEGMTERELAELNEIPRVWDSGKIRWILTP